MTSPAVLAHLRNGAISVVIVGDEGCPWIAYIGPLLTDSDVVLAHRGVMSGGLDTEVRARLLPTGLDGWMGRPGLSGFHIDQMDQGCELLLASVRDFTDGVVLSLRDNLSSLLFDITAVLTDGGVLQLSAEVRNIGGAQFVLDAVRLTVPINAEVGELLTLGGRHAMEAVPQRTPWGRSTMVIENRSGRTSHERLGVVFAGTPHFGEQHGHVFGCHIGWSGNFEFVCDGVTESTKVIQVGELLAPGEVVLASGATYVSPVVHIAYSAEGLNAVSRSFHSVLRSKPGHADTSRPITLNTWEAVYFTHDLTTLTALADVAASVGVERFVLDDGWFSGRRNDSAGLGDWWVDSTVWPKGLAPLTNHVVGLGMEFGLWFEPEMVNPDSDLFREHPDWTLMETPTPLLGRNQLVLNMALTPVRDYLFERISSLLSEYPISYVKWDHNRPLVGGHAHTQTLGMYDLFDQLTTTFPSVQFESCSSGGGRIDFAMAEYVQRFWASDSIDALDRISIQRGISMLIPPEMLGSHIGSPVCHTTGRQHRIAFRAATAMFGWLGVEWNLLDATERELMRLEEVIAIYKSHRALLHAGDIFRGDHPDESVYVHGVIANNKNEALISVTRLHSGPSNHTAPITVQGLDDTTLYLVKHLALGTPVWALNRERPTWLKDGVRMTGRALAHIGIVAPALQPESTMLIHISVESR